MKFAPQLTDEAILRELGGRLARVRIEHDLTQAALAEQAGAVEADGGAVGIGRSVRKPSQPDAEQQRLYDKPGIDWKAAFPAIKSTTTV